MDNSNLVNIRLRLPPSLKAAAAALANANDIFDDNGRHVVSHDVNSALNSLVMLGLERILPFVEKARSEAAEEYKALAEIMRFFLDNPDAQNAFPENFVEGSAAHQHLADCRADMEPDEFGGANRDEQELAFVRQRLLNLTKAQGAIQGILAEREARWAAWEAEAEASESCADNVVHPGAQSDIAEVGNPSDPAGRGGVA
jgi:hypothetical protein